MNPRTKDTFEAELDKARKLLESKGVVVNHPNTPSERSGIGDNFDLPYSTLPDIFVAKWTKVTIDA